MNPPARQNRELPLAQNPETGEILLYINYCTGDGVEMGMAENDCDRAIIGLAGDLVHNSGTGQMKRQTGDGMGISNKNAGTATGTAGGRPCGALTR